MPPAVIFQKEKTKISQILNQIFVNIGQRSGVKVIIENSTMLNLDRFLDSTFIKSKVKDRSEKGCLNNIF